MTSIKDKKASTADLLENLFHNEFKLPQITNSTESKIAINLRSDNGGEFVSAVVKVVCDKYGVRKLEGSAYSPWLQGLVERLNQTLNGLLKQIMQLERNTRWKSMYH